MENKLLIPTLLIALAAAACGNDNGGDLLDAGGTMMNEDAGCQVEPNFTSLHDKILATGRCNAPGCHDVNAIGASGGSLSLAGGKAAAYAELVSESTFDGAAMIPNRVKANEPQASYLYRKLLPNPPSQSRMPLGCFENTCLPQCEIKAFEDWINAGAMND